MRVLITGGTGLIGRALSANLVADGHEVIVLTRSPERSGSAGRATHLPDGVRIERWDASTTKGWGHLADGAEAIVNLAGSSIAGEGFFPSRWTDELRRVIRESRLNSSRAVVEAVAQAEQKPRVVIQASGVGYYGYRGDEELIEDAESGDDWAARFTAAEWEPSTVPVEEMGVRRAVARIGLVLSTEDGALPRLLLPFRLFVGGTMGNGDQWYSWIHLEDQVFPKRCGHLEGKELVPPEVFCDKIAAAVDAKSHADFLVIARTDARGVDGYDEAVRRAQRYLEAGADAIFPEALPNEEEFRRFAKDVDAPLLANMTEFGKTPCLTVAQLESMGYAMVIFPVTLQRTAMKAMEHVLDVVKREGSQASMIDAMQTRDELYELIGYRVETGTQENPYSGERGNGS